MLEIRSCIKAGLSHRDSGAHGCKKTTQRGRRAGSRPVQCPLCRCTNAPCIINQKSYRDGTRPVTAPRLQIILNHRPDGQPGYVITLQKCMNLFRRSA